MEYYLLDVITTEKFGGNRSAVFTDQKKMLAGVSFLYIHLKSVNTMKKIQFRQDIWEKYFKIIDNAKYIFTFTKNTDDLPVDIYSRMFAPAMGIIS